jgi:hypothetical protein
LIFFPLYFQDAEVAKVLQWWGSIKWHTTRPNLPGRMCQALPVPY